MNVRPEPATVYRARNNRRYLTKHGAIMASVNWFFKKHCECESANFDEEGRCWDEGECCRYHDLRTEKKIRARLARHLTYNDSRSR